MLQVEEEELKKSEIQIESKNLITTLLKRRQTRDVSVDFCFGVFNSLRASTEKNCSHIKFFGLFGLHVTAVAGL